MNVLSVVFTFYKTLDLNHLERAIYSLAQQDKLYDWASELVFVDNNTDFDPAAIREVVDPYFDEPFVDYHFLKHKIDERRHSWSANYGIRQAANDRVFFCRADYILTEDCLDKMASAANPEPLPFVSGWCWQMACKRQDAQESKLQVYGHEPIYEAYAWRSNTRFLLQHPWAHKFHETDQDAGVYVTTKEAMEKGGWYDEQMVNFGYQQSTLQRRMRNAGVKMWALQEYLFIHQHHDANRDFTVALQEYRESRGG